MLQKTKSVYSVGTGEVVSVEIGGAAVGDPVSVALDGVKLSPVSTEPLTFSFAVMAMPGGSHSVTVDCRFPSDTADHKRFEIGIQGSFGGEFEGQEIASHDPPPHRRIVRFEHPSET